MNVEFPFKVTIQFPGDLEYIPSVRKFVSEMLQVSSFSPKFAYRSEIIVDEICNNAVNYGSITDDARVDLLVDVFNDHIEFTIKDQGGNRDHIKRLKDAMKVEVESRESKDSGKRGLGLEIVRMLSEKIDFEIDKKNLTSIRITRKREDTEAKTEA